MKTCGRFGTALLTLGLMWPGAVLADFDLTILHTNDFHSRIEPINRFDSTCGEEDNAAGKCFGGAARLATLIAERRAAAGPSLLLDGGDPFQGSLFYTHYKGAAAAEIMNALGYDAMAVGNHEFDDGPEVLRNFMDAVAFPVLMANADVSREPALADVFTPSTILEVDGEAIGLIGLTPQNNDELASPGPNITFTDPVAAVQREVERFQAEGINKIIVLSHSGLGVDVDLASKVPGVDVIIGGHSHTLLANNTDAAAGPYPTWVEAPDGNRTAIIQAYAYGKYLGELTVRFDENGVVTQATGDPLLVDGTIAENLELKQRVAVLAEPLEEIRNTIVAVTETPIGADRDACRSRECEMGTLVADAMLDRVKDQGIQIAIQNGGGLRAAIDAGEITMGDILTVLPFQNTLSTFQMSGAGVLAALENGVSQVEGGAGRFPQVAGMTYAFDASQPAGSRVSEVQVKVGDSWQPLDPDKVYGVVTNNYMRAGGDGYAVLAEQAIDPYDYGPGLEEVVADYLASSNGYTPYTDGRIVVR